MRRFLIILVLLAVSGGLYWYFTHTASPIAFVGNNSASETVPATQSEYSDPDFHFKLSYPSDLVTESFDEEEGGKTITFQSDTPEIAFQIFVVPYTEKAITDARFKKDEPSGVMNEPKDITIDGAAAKVFTGKNDKMGDTREVWFIKNGLLYEVTAYKTLDTWLGDILLTWKFI